MVALFSNRRQTSGRQEHAAGTDDAAEQTVGRRANDGGRAADDEEIEEQEGDSEDLSAVFDVRGLQGRGVRRLDPGAAGL